MYIRMNRPITAPPLRRVGREVGGGEAHDAVPPGLLDPARGRCHRLGRAVDADYLPLTDQPGGDQRHVADAAADIEHPHPRPHPGPDQHVLGQIAIIVALALQPPELVVRVAEGIGAVGLRAGLASDGGTPDHGILLRERREVDARPRRRNRASG